MWFTNATDIRCCLTSTLCSFSLMSRHLVVSLNCNTVLVIFWLIGRSEHAVYLISCKTHYTNTCGMENFIHCQCSSKKLLYYVTQYSNISNTSLLYGLCIRTVLYTRPHAVVVTVHILVKLAEDWTRNGWISNISDIHCLSTVYHLDEAGHLPKKGQHYNTRKGTVLTSQKVYRGLCVTTNDNISHRTSDVVQVRLAGVGSCGRETGDKAWWPGEWDESVTSSHPPKMDADRSRTCGPLYFSIRSFKAKLVRNNIWIQDHISVIQLLKLVTISHHHHHHHHYRMTTWPLELIYAS